MIKYAIYKKAHRNPDEMLWSLMITKPRENAAISKDNEIHRKCFDH